MNTANLIIRAQNAITRQREALAASREELKLLEKLGADNAVKNVVIVKIQRQQGALAIQERTLALLQKDEK